MKKIQDKLEHFEVLFITRLSKFRIITSSNLSTALHYGYLVAREHFCISNKNEIAKIFRAKIYTFASFRSWLCD